MTNAEAANYFSICGPGIYLLVCDDVQDRFVMELADEWDSVLPDDIEPQVLSIEEYWKGAYSSTALIVHGLTPDYIAALQLWRAALDGEQVVVIIVSRQVGGLLRKQAHLASLFRGRILEIEHGN